MKLIPIEEYPDADEVLYALLAERPVGASISHKKMPTWEEHLLFVEIKKPEPLLPAMWHNGQYRDWCLIEVDARIVGSVYLTAQSEIGISIFKEHHGKGYGSDAVVFLMQKHGERRYVANVAPTNEASRKMFEKLGFKHIQNTFALEAE